MQFKKAARLRHQVFKMSDLIINKNKSLMLPNGSGHFEPYIRLKV